MNKGIIAENVRNLRKKRKLSQENLAKLANVSRNYISMIERGEAENYSDEIIKKLAYGLQTTVGVITGSPSIHSGANIPPALHEFALQENLPYEAVDTLLKIPFRGKPPITVDDWKELYEAIMPYLTKD